jgi:hypothetical protein
LNTLYHNNRINFAVKNDANVKGRLEFG